MGAEREPWFAALGLTSWPSAVEPRRLDYETAWEHRSRVIEEVAEAKSEGWLPKTVDADVVLCEYAAGHSWGRDQPGAFVIYRGYHIVLNGGRYMVYAKYDDTFGYTDRKGTFNTRSQAQKWVRDIKAANSHE